MRRTEAETVKRLNDMIEERCRVTDGDFGGGLPMRIEAEIIERMVDAGYTIGIDECGENEWWPPEGKSNA